MGKGPEADRLRPYPVSSASKKDAVTEGPSEATAVGHGDVTKEQVALSSVSSQEAAWLPGFQVVLGPIIRK